MGRREDTKMGANAAHAHLCFPGHGACLSRLKDKKPVLSWRTIRGPKNPELTVLPALGKQEVLLKLHLLWGHQFAHCQGAQLPSREAEA